jgi:hypothetical protein
LGFAIEVSRYRITARVTRHARESFHFKTARFACSGARDGYPKF